jgi:hypothetical protein
VQSRFKDHGMSDPGERLLLCMKWGTRYGVEYANRLYAMTARNMTAPFRFVCFTDDKTGLDPAIDARPLPSLPGVPESLAWTPWRKVSIWSAGLDADLLGRDALFLDLDVVVVGPLDDFFDHEPGRYVVIENWTKRGRGIGNTSVFRTRLGAHPEVYDTFIADPVGVQRRDNIEQELISRLLQGEQAYWPSAWCRSFKEELLPAWPQRLWAPAALPPDARIVVFHGKPDPADAAQGRWPSPWYKKTYKTIRPAAWIGEHWR